MPEKRDLPEQSDGFKKAVTDSKKLKEKPTDQELLDLYGLYKQGIQDPPIDQAKAPGMFEMREKAKRAAWQKVVDKNWDATKAQTEYVIYVNDLKRPEKYGFKG